MHLAVRYALSQVPPDGWIKLRRELQPASALPSATSFLHGEAGPSGSHGAAQGGRDGQAASAAGGSAPGPKRGLSAVFEFAMRDRLESGGRGLSHVEDMLLIEEALDLLPSVLEGMRTARGPAYSDRRGQGAPRGNVWVCAKPQGRSSAAGAATLLKDLAVPHQCEAVYTANVAMMSWPLLVTDCKRFPAWGCLYSKAAQSPSAQPVSTGTPRRVHAAPLHRIQAPLPSYALHADGGPQCAALKLSSLRAGLPPQHAIVRRIGHWHIRLVYMCAGLGSPRGP